MLHFYTQEGFSSKIALAAGESIIRPGQLEGRAEDILMQFYERCFGSRPSVVRTFVEDRLLAPPAFAKASRSTRLCMNSCGQA